MSDHFEWNTEEDESVWEEQVEQFVVTREPRKRPYKALAVIALLFVVAVGVVYWQVQQRVEIATANVRADLLSTHNLINRAVELQDVNLLAPLLSGRDMTWTRHQEAMMRDDALFGRTALGLPLAEPAANLTAEDDRLVGLELSPDLNSAELQFIEKYQFGADEVMLQQTAVYRRGRERWLMAPPEDEFWGDWETFEVDGITFVFPERDAELGERLAEQLAENLYADCDRVDLLKCPDLRLLFVRFDTDLASLVATADPENLFDARLRLDLPAPTLVGYPMNDAGFVALVQAYEAQIFTAVLAEAMDYDCCHHAPFVQAITDYYLAGIELKRWPVDKSTYGEIANEEVLTIDRLFTNWSDANFLTPWDEEKTYVYGFVDFLMSANPEKSPLLMLQRLNEPQGIQAGLAGLFDGRYGRGVRIQDTAIRDWWIYARAHAFASEEERPLPLPSQDLQIICSRDSFTNESPESVLYRYDPAIGEWQTELEKLDFVFFSPLPGDEAIFLQDIDIAADQWRSSIWQNGERRTLTNDSLPTALSLGQTNPQGQTAVFFAEPTADDAFAPYLMDLTDCDEAGCTTHSLEGVPIWSPNGERTLVASINIFEDAIFFVDDRVSMFTNSGESFPASIVLGDEKGQPLREEERFFETGLAPFWLTDEMFGFITVDDDPANPRQELVIGQIDDSVVRTLISTTNLLHAIPEEERPLRLTMRYVVASPTDPTMLAVMATARNDGYLFVVNQESGEVELRVQVGVESTHTMSFSPDGRYIVMTGNVEDTPNYMGVFHAMYIHDLAAKETEVIELGLNTFTPSFTYDWSGDQNWLAYVYGNGFIWLYAPEYGYQETIEHNFGECTSLAWVN